MDGCCAITICMAVVVLVQHLHVNVCALLKELNHAVVE